MTNRNPDPNLNGHPTPLETDTPDSATQRTTIPNSDPSQLHTPTILIYDGHICPHFLFQKIDSAEVLPEIGIGQRRPYIPERLDSPVL